mgnify:FL=1
MPCILNAANEVAVQLFLAEKIRFTQISEVIEKVMSKTSFIAKPTYEDYVRTDEEARRISRSA